MTPAEAAAHNLTAPLSNQARTCPSCGRIFTGPAHAGWRQVNGNAYARTGYCSEPCLMIDIEDHHIADVHHLSRIVCHLADHPALTFATLLLLRYCIRSRLLDIATRIATSPISKEDRALIADIASALQDTQSTRTLPCTTIP